MSIFRIPAKMLVYLTKFNSLNHCTPTLGTIGHLYIYQKRGKLMTQPFMDWVEGSRRTLSTILISSIMRNSKLKINSRKINKRNLLDKLMRVHRQTYSTSKILCAKIWHSWKEYKAPLKSSFLSSNIFRPKNSRKTWVYPRDCRNLRSRSLRHLIFLT